MLIATVDKLLASENFSECESRSSTIRIFTNDCTNFISEIDSAVKEHLSVDNRSPCATDIEYLRLRGELFEIMYEGDNQLIAIHMEEVLHEVRKELKRVLYGVERKIKNKQG